MKYDWEESAKQGYLADHGYDLGIGQTGEMYVIGIAVVNYETGEGALIKLDTLPNDVTGADMAKDILGDANTLYSDATANGFAAKLHRFKPIDGGK